MPKPLALCVLLLLNACATPTLTSSVATRDVAVAVVTPCVTAQDVAPLPKTEMRADADVAALAAGAAVDVKQLRDLARRQRAMLLACTTQQEKKP